MKKTIVLPPIFLLKTSFTISNKLYRGLSKMHKSNKTKHLGFYKGQTNNNSDNYTGLYLPLIDQKPDCGVYENL